MAQVAKVTITSGQTASAAVRLEGTLRIIYIPASMTGVTLKIHGSVDGTNYFVLKDTANADVSITISSAAAFIHLGTLNLVGLQTIKLVSGSAESGDKTLTLYTE